MEQNKLDRINELARLSKTRQLTEDEKKEQKKIKNVEKRITKRYGKVKKFTF